jgi:hypothetical protein
MFRFADPLRDEELNLAAQRSAQDVLALDPDLTHARHVGIRAVLTERYARSLELFRVG